MVLPAVALVAGRHLYVADVNTGAIKQFNSAGQGSTFANVGAVNPVGLAVDAAGNLLWRTVPAAFREPLIASLPPESAPFQRGHELSVEAGV